MFIKTITHTQKNLAFLWQGRCHRSKPTSKPRAERDMETAKRHLGSKVQWGRDRHKKASHAKTGGRRTEVATVCHRRAGVFGCTDVAVLYGCMLTPVFLPALREANKKPHRPTFEKDWKRVLQRAWSSWE